MSLEKFLEIITDSIINTEKNTLEKYIFLMLRIMEMKKRTEKRKRKKNTIVEQNNQYWAWCIEPDIFTHNVCS